VGLWALRVSSWCGVDLSGAKSLTRPPTPSLRLSARRIGCRGWPATAVTSLQAPLQHRPDAPLSDGPWMQVVAQCRSFVARAGGLQSDAVQEWLRMTIKTETPRVNLLSLVSTPTPL
jgi:hypothetical protein